MSGSLPLRLHGVLLGTEERHVLLLCKSEVLERFKTYKAYKIALNLLGLCSHYFCSSCLILEPYKF
jgi:hypothetical protein